MSPFDDPISRTDLDRLVDDELDDAERQALLLRLEADLANWRDCALAFLEAQSWRKSMRTLLPAVPADRTIRAIANPPTVVSRSPEVARIAPRGRLPATALITVGLLLAFVSGLGLGTSWSREAAPLNDDRQISARQTGGLPHGTSVPSRDDGTDPIPTEQTVGRTADEALAMRTGPPTDIDRRDFEQSDAPVATLSPQEQAWLRQVSQPLSDYSKQQFERNGYRVREERRLVSVELADGRQVTLPINVVDLQYVGHRLY
jgi:hypothetical protein